MSSKRSFSEAGDDEAGGEVEPANDANGRPPFKKPKKEKKKHKAKEGTMPWTKKRVRDIERRLQRNQELPADVQVELGRELSAHQSRLEGEKEKKQRNTMIKKYHMVRFFERKKAQRLEKQLRQQLERATTADERAALEADMHIAQVDVQYTRYFPFMERYASLYPTTAPDPGTDETARAKLALHTPRPPLWSTVEKAMAQGEDALLRLQNRRLDADSHAKPPPERPPRHAFAARAGALARGLQSDQHGGNRAAAGAAKGDVVRGADYGGSRPERSRRHGRPWREGAGQDRQDEVMNDDSKSGGFFEEI